MYQRQTVGDEIDLLALPRALWRRRGIVLVTVTAAALITAGISLFALSPMYESRTQILLSEHSAPAFATPDAAARFLMAPSFLDPIARQFDLELTPRLVRVTPVREARMVDLRIRYGDRSKLLAFTNAVVEDFTRRAAERVEARRELTRRRLATVDAQVREVEQTLRVTRQTLERMLTGTPGDATSWLARSVALNSVGATESLYNGLLAAQRDLLNEILAMEPPVLVQSPHIPTNPISPRPVLNVILAALLGLLAGVIWTLIMDASASHTAASARME